MAIRNAEDRRVRKTRKQLRTALMTLLLKKDIDHITVRDVSELADVNRGTFYAHYKDVEELLSQLEEELFSALQVLGEKYRGKFSEEDALAYLTEVITLAGENGDMVYALHSTTVDMDFQNRLHRELKTQYLAIFMDRLGLSGSNADLMVAFITSGVIAVCIQWIEGGKKETPAELAQLCGSLVQKGVHSLRDDL